MNDPLLFTRRDFGKLALAGLPLSMAFADINSKFKGVQIGAITYSFRSMSNPDDIINAYKTIGLGEMELMSGDAEKLAGAPIPAGGGFGGGRRGMTPEQQAEMTKAQEALRAWRLSATEATFRPVKKKIEDAGIDLQILCYNMNVNSTKDDEIEYGFMMAKALGVNVISTSTQVSMAKRTAPFAGKHKIKLAFHGHDQTQNPDEVSSPDTFAAITAASKYHAINLDIGHFTAANFDPVSYIQQHHDRITHLHLKDRKKDHGANLPWGQGDTPIKEVLLLLRDKKYKIPGNIEFEYQGDPMVEIPKCVQYAKEVLNA
jgi:sugar phosphate isomerase/epimerase